eukprot:CAMPEP_0117439044 /NCGR_PEP_ID=MMETSP0759-20121206/2366_1 /TAXON_ID=63605 /ORGANISM="Percolomonas cosmopolitus, Strain WS" /LENGTH=143 /DNA_ID=CAMNT_0005230755 /DNA_START=377 /DNA_END=808 /DNA_ORIENTATION=-
MRDSDSGHGRVEDAFPVDKEGIEFIDFAQLHEAIASNMKFLLGLESNNSSDDDLSGLKIEAQDHQEIIVSAKHSHLLSVPFAIVLLQSQSSGATLTTWNDTKDETKKLFEMKKEDFDNAGFGKCVGELSKLRMGIMEQFLKCD